MPVEYGRESNYAKEMRKHEAFATEFGPAGRPYVYQEFPQMMYKAEFVEGKGIQLVDHTAVSDDDAMRNLLSRGFYVGPQAAYDAALKAQTDHGKLAAEREYEIQHNRISERAVNEVRAAETEFGTRHMPVVPETPVSAHQKKRGRKPKITTN